MSERPNRNQLFSTKGFRKQDYLKDPKFRVIMDQRHQMYRVHQGVDPIIDPKRKWIQLLRPCTFIDLPNLQYRDKYLKFRVKPPNMTRASSMPSIVAKAQQAMSNVLLNANNIQSRKQSHIQIQPQKLWNQIQDEVDQELAQIIQGDVVARQLSEQDNYFSRIPKAVKGVPPCKIKPSRNFAPKALIQECERVRQQGRATLSDLYELNANKKHTTNFAQTDNYSPTKKSANNSVFQDTAISDIDNSSPQIKTKKKVGVEATILKMLEDNQHDINPKKLKKEHKIIQTLVKKFNVHIHTNNLLKQDREYLKELHNQINNRLEYMCTGKILLFDNGRKSRPGSRLSTMPGIKKNNINLSGIQSSNSSIQVFPPTTKQQKIRKSHSIGQPSNFGSTVTSPKHIRGLNQNFSGAVMRTKEQLFSSHESYPQNSLNVVSSMVNRGQATTTNKMKPQNQVNVITEEKIGKKVGKLLKKLTPQSAFSKENLNKQLNFMGKQLDKYKNFWNSDQPRSSQKKLDFLTRTSILRNKQRGGNYFDNQKLQVLDQNVKLAEVFIDKNKFKAPQMFTGASKLREKDSSIAKFQELKDRQKKIRSGNYPARLKMDKVQAKIQELIKKLSPQQQSNDYIQVSE